MNYLKRTSALITLFSISFFILVRIKPGEGYSDFLFLFSAAAAVIFGIFIVFTVSNSRDRLNKANELLKTENANNLLVYKLSSVFGIKIQSEIRELIDAYLIDQVDYRLEEFYRSRKSFHALHDFVINLDPKSKAEERALSEMISILTSSSVNRVQIETIVVQKLSKFEWASAIILTAVVVSHLYEMSHEGGGTLQSLMLTALASACVLLVLILRDLDSLKWQKDLWTWRPLHYLFVSIDLIPYYPRIAITNGEVKLPVGEKVRIADYPNAYPDMTGKTIEVSE